ncbi:MAG: hypothetical protein AB9903_06840 [Vulcanimicrobiota bacterium]
MTFGPLNLPSFNLSEIKTDMPAFAEALPASSGGDDVATACSADGEEMPPSAEQLTDSFCAAGPGSAGDSAAHPSVNHSWHCSTTSRMIAREGRAAMQNAKNAAEQCYIGENSARKIFRASGEQSIEHAIAESALKAYHSLRNIESAVKLLAVTLGAIAGGVQGPIGLVLGRVGHDALANAVNPDDKCGIGTTFCIEIAQKSGDPTEQKIAEAAINAYPHMGTSATASYMLDHIMQSMSPWGYGPFEAVMGKTAVDIIDRSRLVKDKCAVGYSFTQSIRDNTTSSSEKNLAQTALDDFAKSPDAAAGAAVLRKYLYRFTASPPVPPPPPAVLSDSFSSTTEGGAAAEMPAGW